MKITSNPKKHNNKKRKPLTNKAGEVRELSREDIQAMRPANEVLSRELLKTLLKHKINQ